MNSATFRIQIPDTFVGNGAVDNIGALVKQLGGKKVLIVTDTGIVQAGLVDKVKQSLEKESNSGILRLQTSSLLTKLDKLFI